MTICPCLGVIYSKDAESSSERYSSIHKMILPSSIQPFQKHLGRDFPFFPRFSRREEINEIHMRINQ